MVIVGIFLAVAAAKNWELHQMDVHKFITVSYTVIMLRQFI